MKGNPDPEQESRSARNGGDADSDATPPESHILFVTPRGGREDGFRASVRGHILDLVDSGSYALAPTADDLFIVSIAAPLAWSARDFLSARGLPDYVSVAAAWRTYEDRAGPADINLKVTVSKRAETASVELAALLDESLAARRRAKPAVHLSLEGS